MIRVRTGAVIWCLLFAAAPAQDSPSIHLLDVDSESYVSGSVILRAALTGVRVPVESVRFFANGVLVCTLVGPPYECAWDAGPQVRAQQIRVVAELADGTRLVETVRTKELGYAETVKVEVVHVPVLVTDGRRRFVRGLQAQAFRLFDEGDLQEITYFASHDQPLEIVLAIDISSSMGPAIGEVQKAVGRFLQAVRRHDSVTLIAFNDKVFTLARRQASVEERQQSVTRLSAWGGTALHDAILRGLELLGHGTGRKALVVFTDGDDRSSRATHQQVERALRQSDVVLHSIGVGARASSAPFRQVLERLAQESGGRALFIRRATELDIAFASIIEELSHYYVLGYTPTVTGREPEWRRIRVELTNARHNIRAREGYLAQPQEIGR